MYRDYPVRRLIKQLERDNLLPAILFRSSRASCDEDIKVLSRSENMFVNRKQSEHIEATIANLAQELDIEMSLLTQHEQYEVLVTTGVGAHHAGQLLQWRLILEELMSKGLLRLLVATGTVAAGVDFPARTAIITAHTKRDRDGYRTILASEFQQMSGRAGRRGRDNVGICLVAPSQYADARVLAEVSKKEPEPLRSCYFASPSTVLNLLKFRQLEDLNLLVSHSLRSFHDGKEAELKKQEAKEILEGMSETLTVRSKTKIRKRAEALKKEADALETFQARQLQCSIDSLKLLGFIDVVGDRCELTRIGSYASELCCNLVLELALAIEDQLFDDISVEELVGLVGSIAGDHYRTYFNLKNNPISNRKFDRLSKVVERVNGAYKSPLRDEIKVQPDAALTVIEWMETPEWMDFESILKLSKCSPGDGARLISQTADHLHQLSRLSATHPLIAEAAAYGRRRLLRPPLTD